MVKACYKKQMNYNCSYFNMVKFDIKISMQRKTHRDLTYSASKKKPPAQAVHTTRRRDQYLQVNINSMAW